MIQFILGFIGAMIFIMLGIPLIVCCLIAKKFDWELIKDTYKKIILEDK